MIQKTRFFAGSFVGIMCLTLCFGSLAVAPDGVVFYLAVSLATLIGLLTVTSFFLYRAPTESKRFRFWPLLVLTAPALITLFVSLYSARERFGALSVSIGCLLWFVVSLSGFFYSRRGQVVGSNSGAKMIPAIAAMGAVVPSILSAFGILDRDAFVSVFCYFTLACGLSFTVASLFGAIRLNS
jgi:hypothetical protein